METCGEAVRESIRTGSRRCAKNVAIKEQTSSLVTFLTTVAPVVMASSSNETLPTTQTWFPVSKRPKKRQSNDKDAKTAAKKRKRLGQAKMKRDRIQQELDGARSHKIYYASPAGAAY